MRGWVPVSAVLAPVALIGGWSWAQARQPAGFDPTRDTISALAAHGAADRWIMTTGLAVLGGCHLATAAGLTEADGRGRLALAVGGLGTVAVAVLAQPSAGHVPAAAVAFIGLTAWPAVSRLPLGRSAGVGLGGLLGWLAVELRGGDLLGLSERLLAGGQAVWPLATVALVAGRARRSRRLLVSR